ncbi:hypothetical protein FJY68_02325 [candidate division WOR-3 bacterium]|uniref:Tail specific protease domain-containing protein n=1 Tax=candidate division WOR-3 bacterium TaxID=2052148 RepID=A0A938BT80_UNCW3|nr:hypothetical protein [candidate division WOR-3 bacterium]
MRRTFVLAAATAALVSAALWAEPIDRLSEPLPAAIPDWLDAPTLGSSPPPHWIPKQTGHYDSTDWRRVIDSTWGSGLPVDEKLAIFDMFWDTVDAKYACFHNLDVNWDSLRTVYRSEIEDTVSRGRFAAIMNHLGWALRDAHTYVRDWDVNYYAQLLPGVPLWVIGGWGDVSHFGAGLTPLPDSSLLVYRVVPDHPLGLERSDVVLGYDGRRWTEVLRELKEAELPMHVNYIYGSCSTAVTHALLNAAGENWHLFDTIDIVKYTSGDTVHLPTSLLADDTMHLFATEQLDIPGVTMPSSDSNPSVTFGVVSGRLIGYIYGWRWWTATVSTEFYNAINALLRISGLKGIVIDFRYNEGGGFFKSNRGLALLFKDSTPTICFSARNSPGNHFSMAIYDPGDANVIPGNGIGFDKPIAVLVGPAAVSSGDHVAYRMTFHPRVRTFGRSISTTFNSPTGLDIDSGWGASYAVGEASPVSDPTYFLTRREFPVDVPVWHTRSAVARGEDTVVTVAMAWIDSVAGVAESPKPQAASYALEPTIVRGVLFLPKSASSSSSTSCLLDISGRKVMVLEPGANDVSRLSPGVYFIRGPRTEVCKIALTR